MNDLTAANAALMSQGNVEKMRVMMGRDFTPSTHDIALMLPMYMDDLVRAEEYGHYTLSKEEAIRRAKGRVDITYAALKESVICDIKQRRGEWIAHA